ncbi:ATP-dependent DNA helicase [Mycoplasma todarodis]|uniref:AAA+ ATPase domain-containing protein n=1 Tax=Mycoplasma todarodis TaxID=1937191 RepID=A0A4R0XMM9_9MOLU|nr:ATP-dependent RecD-like DNA helicase [Mycoplasma todarodis]TCG11970.1 hypothetical protein C4B25_00500 [Mycoplasma todarodis]
MKIQEYIMEYNEIINCMQKKKFENISMERGNYFFIARKMIEAMFKEYREKEGIKFKKITKFLEKSNLRKQKFNWMKLNNICHDQEDEEVIINIHNHNHALVSLADFLGYKLKQTQSNEIFKNLEWQYKAEKKNEYPALIERKQDGYYIVSHRDRGYEQKNKYMIISDIELSVGIHYKISTKIEELFVNGEPTNIILEKITDAEALPLKNTYIEPNLLEVINKIVQKHHMSPLDFVIAFPDSSYSEELRGIFIKDTRNSFLWNIVCLKYFDKVVINDNYKLSPLNFEFWTKNPRGKGISLFEKKKLKEILLKDKTTRNFTRIKNAEFEQELKKRGKYLKEGKFDINEFPDNYKFSPNYPEKKVVEYKGYITLQEIANLIKLFEKTMQNDEIEFKIDKKIIYWDKKRVPNKEQLASINNALRNSRTLIIGPAGTGKTKTAATIINSFISAKETYMFLAPTHKAKSVVEEMGINDIEQIANETIQKVIHNPHLLEFKENVIIDEISMVNDNDWIGILDIIKDKKRIILMGDSKQLPPLHSIGITKLFDELEFMDEIKNELITNMRQEKQEDRKEVDSLRGNHGFIHPENYFEDYYDFKDALRIVKEYEKNEFKIITPLNSGLFGTKALNLFLGNTIKDIKPGDKFMISETIKGIKFLFQNLELKVEKFSNGIITFAKRFKQNVLFEGQKENFFFLNNKLHYKIGKEEDMPFIGSKVITVHASQGSTYDNVLLVLPPNYEISQEMLYTASTRFKKKFKILVCKDFNIDKYSESTSKTPIENSKKQTNI